jgi:flagellum-specific peptidoglycan hydrolase FlgJ
MHLYFNKPNWVSFQTFPVCLILTIAILGQPQKMSGQKKYIERYKKLADSLSKSYKIPSCVILGVATVESSSGAGKTVSLLNNHFGIVGKNNLMKTNGIKTRYKYYPSDTASFIDFAKLVSRRKFYKSMTGKNTCTDWITAISKTGYSEKPDVWKKRIMDVINLYKL